MFDSTQLVTGIDVELEANSASFRSLELRGQQSTIYRLEVSSDLRHWEHFSDVVTDKMRPRGKALLTVPGLPDQYFRVAPDFWAE